MDEEDPPLVWVGTIQSVGSQKRTTTKRWKKSYFLFCMYVLSCPYTFSHGIMQKEVSYWITFLNLGLLILQNCKSNEFLFMINFPVLGILLQQHKTDSLVRKLMPVGVVAITNT